VVGEALNAIAKSDPEVLDAVLDVLETDQLIASGAELDVLPRGAQILIQLGHEPGTRHGPQRGPATTTGHPHPATPVAPAWPGTDPR
jgi:hypothetical protein